MPSCDQTSVDRKKARYKVTLHATDRLRLTVFMTGGREMFSWAEPLKFESHDLEEVLAAGPIGTGAFGAFYMNLFENPQSRFQYLGEKSGKLEYGFRESSEASHHIVKAGERWSPTAHAGSFLIDPESLDLERLTSDVILPNQSKDYFSSRCPSIWRRSMLWRSHSASTLIASPPCKRAASR
jgi:hypothetical protein